MPRLHQIIVYSQKKNNSEFLEDISWKQEMQWGHPTIANFPEYLFSFRTKHCFVVIDNWNFININSDNTTPLIVRRFVEGVTTSDSEIDVISRPWVPANFNISCELFLNMNCSCPISKLLAGPTFRISRVDESHTLTAFCLRINLKEYSKYIKPWNCYAQIRLFIPLEVAHHDWSFWKIFQIEVRRSLYSYLFAASVPGLHIFVQLHDVENATSILANFLYDATYKIRSSLSWTMDVSPPDILVVFKVQRKISFHPFSELVDACSRIYEVDIFKLYPLTWKSMQERYKPYGEYSPMLLNLRKLGDPTDLVNTAKLKTLAFPSMAENIFWVVEEISDDKTVSHHILHYLSFCQEIPKLSSKSWLRRISLHDRLGHAYAHVWLSIMNNFTVLSRRSGSRFCYGGEDSSIYYYPERLSVQLDRAPYIRWLLYSPHFIQDGLDGLRFVSYGEKTLSSIPFQDLINVFDEYIWTCMLVSGGLILTLFSLLTFNDRNVGSPFVSLLRTILEQGGFPKSIETKCGLAYVICPTLLAGILLSNAYKNTNAYRMILPRVPVAYETFLELAADNFALYSRFQQVSISTYKQPVNSSQKFSGTFYTEKHGLYKVYGKFLKVHSHSEVDIARFRYKAAVRELDKTKKSNSILIKLGIWEKARLHLDALNILRNMLDGTNSNPNDTEKGELIQNVKSKELEVLYGILGKCSRVALILPEIICNEFARKIKEEYPSAPVFVGKEEYTEIDWMIKLSGYVAPHIIKHVKGIGERGIWRRWMNLANETLSRAQVKDDGHVKAASMSGNVVVIFVVLWFGMMLGCIAIFLEIIVKHFICFLQDKIMKY